MDLRTYLNALPTDEQAAFAARCGTTIGYLRKGLSTGAQFKWRLAIAIEEESGGAVPATTLNHDFADVCAYVRRADKPKSARPKPHRRSAADG